MLEHALRYIFRIKPFKHVSCTLCLTIVIFTLGLNNACGFPSINTQDSTKPKFGNYFNIGVSAGIGEGHMNFIVPSLAVKIGRFNFKGLYAEYDLMINEAYQLQYDLFQLKSDHPTRSTFITLSAGVSQKKPKTERPEKFEIHYIQSFGFGACSYLNHRRSRISFNMSASNYSIRTQQNFYLRERPQLFGQISFSQYIFRFGDFRDRDIFTSAIERRRNRPIKIKESKFPLLAEWFNPFLSVGIGMDRASLIVPALGLKLGPFNGKVSYNLLYSAAYDLNLDLVNLTSTDKYERKLGLGFNQFFDNSTTISGVTCNLSRYRKNKKMGTIAKLGIARHDGGGLGWIVNVGLSVNFYTFRFGEPNIYKKEGRPPLNYLKFE